MSTKDRFKHTETFTRTGRVVVVVRDTAIGRDHFIHRQGQTLLHWKAAEEDRLVENGLLRGCARSALDNYNSQQKAKIGRPCIRCHNPFKPEPGSRAKTCPVCISAIGKRSSAVAHGREAA